MDWNKEIKMEDITKLVRKNPIGVFAVVILFVVIVIVAISVSIKKPGAASEVLASSSAVKVDALPQTERKSDSQATLSFDKNPFQTDILLNAYLTGVMSVEGGYKTAIIVSDYGSFVARVGDKIGKSDWVVNEITDTEVKVKNGDASLTIKFLEYKDSK